MTQACLLIEDRCTVPVEFKEKLELEPSLVLAQ